MPADTSAAPRSWSDTPTISSPSATPGTRREQVKARLAEWLAPRGLAFNEDKTRIVTLDEGFDFLGFNVRRYHGKLLIKPSKAAVRRIRERLRAEMRSLRGTNAQAVIRTTQPDHPGLGGLLPDGGVQRDVPRAGHLHVEAHLQVGDHSHPNKSTRWVVHRYFGRFNSTRQDRWVFGDRDSGAYMLKFAWTRIVRHQIVTGAASPDDPALAEYWAARRRKTPPPIDKASRWLLKAQHGRCPICGDALLPAEDQPPTPREWEQWLATTRKTIDDRHAEDGTSDRRTPSHPHPLPPTDIAPATATAQQLLSASEPSGLA